MNETPATEQKSQREGQLSLTELLDQYEARANAATPGPWTHHHGWADSFIDPNVLEQHPNWCEITGEGLSINGHFGVATSTFIAASRSDVPALVKALRKSRDQMAAAIGGDPFCMRPHDLEIANILTAKDS